MRKPPPVRTCSRARWRWAGAPASATALGVALGWSPVAAAQTSPPGASLAVVRGEGAESCPNEDALGKRVEELAKRPVFSMAGPKPIAVKVRIESHDPGFAGVVELSGATRTIEDSGPGCEVLAEALAVTIGILLDVDTKDTAGSAKATDRPGTTPAPTLDEPEAPVRLTAAVAGFYDFGTLQGSSGGVALSGDLLVPYVTFGLAFLGLPQDPTEAPNDRANYRFVAGRVRACARQPFGGQFGAALCSGFTVGERQLDPGPNGGYAGAVVQLEVSRRVVGPFGLFADLGLTFPFWYESIATPGHASPFEPATFQFGIGTRFWIAPYP